MLYMPFLSGSNTLPVKTVLLLNVLKNKKKLKKNQVGCLPFWYKKFGGRE